ncbi:hypothetical protein SDC9_101983 [bioreactor metagenome]|uniref:Uncharacterized protein n=1 Tax=bioreactor metagenome TaxID=1076179 RepID=A0A645AQ10_9ZZZZ
MRLSRSDVPVQDEVLRLVDECPPFQVVRRHSRRKPDLVEAVVVECLAAVESRRLYESFPLAAFPVIHLELQQLQEVFLRIFRTDRFAVVRQGAAQPKLPAAFRDLGFQHVPAVRFVSMASHSSTGKENPGNVGNVADSRFIRSGAWSRCR